MKKLIMALAVVALAFGAQAATMSWSVLNMQSQGVEAGWMVALYDAGSAFDYNAAKDGTLAAAYSGAAYSSGTTIRAGQTGQNNPSGAEFVAGDSISLYAVIFNAANIADATQYMVSAVKTGTVNSSGANFTVAFGNMASTSTANTFLNSSWQSVPEPTSGLLMLVGLGALALRRRRA